VFSLIGSSPASQQCMAVYQHQLVSAVADQLRHDSDTDPGDP
jgi:hypothetical protein